MKKLLILPIFAGLLFVAGPTEEASAGPPCQIVFNQVPCDDGPNGGGNPGGSCPPIKVIIPDDDPCKN